MHLSDFIEHPGGRIIRTPLDYWAYVPASLEPPIELNMALIRRLSDADRAVSELAGVARTLPNPHLLIGPFMRQEAVISSKIEGTQASFSDLLYFEAARIKEDQVPDVREVANYVKAMEYGLSRLNDLPMSLRLIKELHSILMDGVRGYRSTPGEFRRSQNWIGPPGCSLSGASYVPPPVNEMKDALSDLECYFHTETDTPPLLRLAMIHYQFESIHPFLDGNGRIGRLLTALQLVAYDLLPQPLLYLSAFFERNRDQYYDLLLDVSRKGAWETWIMFFLHAVEVQSKDAVTRSDRLLDLWQGYRDRLQEARASALLLQLVDYLFEFPAVTNPMATKKLGVTPRSTQLNIEKLIASGILEEITGQKRNRLYVAKEIINIITE
ncbi:MAG: Fic family protein [Candidatus Fermentibacteraceae bacterium]|nr:Fic family protein [Candidatus Fermentibacteraceae bacterium]MBN2859659.1 Fic family protein [Sphaerochaetaceae bacterium]